MFFRKQNTIPEGVDFPELDPDYFDIAVKRITEAQRQAGLVVAKPTPVKPEQGNLL